MKQFEVKNYTDKEIVLRDPDQVTELYEAIQKEEAIQLKWNDGNLTRSQIIIAGNIAGRVRLGEIMIKSESFTQGVR